MLPQEQLVAKCFRGKVNVLRSLGLKARNQHTQRKSTHSNQTNK